MAYLFGFMCKIQKYTNKYNCKERIETEILYVQDGQVYAKELFVVRNVSLEQRQKMSIDE